MTTLLRLATVRGVMPDKWLRRWREREPEHPLEHSVIDREQQDALLRDGDVDLAIVRLPIDRSGVHAVVLYEETPAVVVAKDHAAAAFDELTLADLAGEIVDASGLSDEQAVELAATGAGCVRMPLPLARAIGAKDVRIVPVTDAEPTTIALAWRVDRDDEVVQRFVGLVKGRTARSSR